MTQENLITFSEKDIELIKNQIIPEGSQEDLEMLLYQAKRTGLNPITRQIYGIFRSVRQGNNWIKKMTVQTSIDGFRVIAERTGDYGGQSEPFFEVDKDGKLICCKMTVFRFRGDTRYPAATAVAYWEEYCQKDKDGNLARMWKDMPRTMLSKVAEALALRKAYPQDLSGLYTNDEMSQSDNPIQKLAKISNDDMKEIRDESNEIIFAGLKAIFESCGGCEELDEAWKSEKSDIAKLKKYAPSLYNMLINTIKNMKESFNENRL